MAKFGFWQCFIVPLASIVFFSSSGIPYLRKSDLKSVPGDLRSIFACLEQSDRPTYKFLNNFVEEYIVGYWIKQWDPSEICYWGDLSREACENMNNNALESYNNELLTLLGRKSHPNPYHFMSTVKSALSRTSQMISCVENGTFEAVKSRKSKKAIDRRHRLKLLYQNRLNQAETFEDEQRARIRYMIGTGGANSRILAKGRKRALKRKVKNADNLPVGRPKYRREKAVPKKKCRFCGRTFASPNGAKSHEKICAERKGSEGTLSCQFCGKLYSKQFWQEAHEKTCKKRNSEQKSEKEMRKHVSQKCNISSSSSDTNDTISSKSSSSSSANSSISEHSSESSNSSISEDSGSEVTIEDIDTREQFSLERELSILGESKSKNDVLASLDRLQDAALCMEIIKNSELEKKVRALAKLKNSVGRQARLLEIKFRRIKEETRESNRTFEDVLDKVDCCRSAEDVMNQILRLETIQPSVEFLLATKAMKKLRAVAGVHHQV